MKCLLAAAMLYVASAAAQAVECPKYFPAEDMRLPTTPGDAKGKVRLQSRHLIHAYMYFGELYGEQTLTPPASRKVRGGWNTAFDFTPAHDNWLICSYGDEAWGGGMHQRWEKLDPGITACVLQVRQSKGPHSPKRWSATARCT